MADYNFQNKICIPFERVKEWSTEVYEKMGMSHEDAEITADIQATADLRGVYSHGIQRCDTYVWRIQNKTINPKAVPEIIGDAGAFVMVDGKQSMGQVSAYRAMEIAIERAKKYGSSTVVVKGGNHMGTMAYFAMMAAKEDMIGICFTQGAGNNIAPTGSSEAILGNNPMGYAVPAAAKAPVVVDLAMTTVAAGKVTMAALTNSEIPLTWALDKEGKPTSDPKQFASLQPIAGYKGYGLSFITTLMTAVMCDSPWGKEQRDLLSHTHKYANEPLDISYMMQVINVGALTDIEAFKKRVDEAIDEVKSAKLSDGAKEILVPGEPESRNEARQLESGIEYPTELITKINELADSIGVSRLI